MKLRSCGPYLYAGILAAVISSSYFSLKQAEALSIYSSGRHYLAKGDFETGAKQLRLAILSGQTTIDLHDAYARLCYASLGKREKKPFLHEALAAFPASPTLNIFKLVADSMEPDFSISNRAGNNLQFFLGPSPQLEIEIGPGVRIDLRDIPTAKSARSRIAGLYHNMGNAFLEREDFERAIVSYGRALEFNPDRKRTYHYLQAALENAGLLSQASLSSLHAGGGIQAANGFQINASVFLAASGRLEEAIGLAHRSFLQKPTETQSKAVFLLYREILKRGPGVVSSPAFEKMGLDLWKGGITGDSITAFRMALEKDQTNSGAHFGLGLVCLAQGQTEEAEKIYAEGMAKFGSKAAVEAGAREGIRALIAQEIQVKAARTILATFFPNDKAAN